jgi:predicted ATPase
MQKEIIAIIGGPGSGKSSILNKLEEKGFCCYPEISREVTLKAKEQGIEQLFLEKPLLFSELLLEGRIKQFQAAQNEPHDIVFIDRGIPDILAYMHYIGNSYPVVFEEACKENKYSKIFVLPPWEDIYVSDNERYENFEQALKIHSYIIKTYKQYGYQLIDIPIDTIENRVDFVLKQLGY